MSGRAPRHPLRPWPSLARGALVSLSLLLAGAGATAACTLPPTSHPDVLPNSIIQSGEVTAWYSTPASRYPHAVLGDDQEPTKLHVLTPDTSPQCGLSLSLSAPYVFEDLAPRLADLDGDDVPELITIRSHAQKGAQIAIYKRSRSELKLIATTPHIGTRFRWLAPAGIADLDGDGHMEIAYIDRPHLAKRLRIWRYQSGKLTHIADKDGLTNHRIGEDFISGGLRTCAGQHAILTANANWTRIMASTLADGKITSKDIGRYRAANLKAALTTCP